MVQRYTAPTATAFTLITPVYDGEWSDQYVSGAAGLDSEISKDGAGFTDCTNELTEIGSTGVYSLSVTSAEMTAGIITIKMTSTTSGANIPLMVIDTTNMPVDMLSVSGDTTAADNLEATYDGTGYTDVYAPAQQIQIDNIAVGSAGISTIATAATVAAGEVIAGTYASTAQRDGVYYQIADDAVTDDIDIYFDFSVGNNGVPSTVTFVGYLNSGNDDLAVLGYNWGSTSWEQIGLVNGKNNTNERELTFSMYSTHVGTGADAGKVRVKYAATGLTSCNFYIDQLYVSYAVVASSVGYAGGAVWIDTNNGTAGTVDYVNGTADNPVNTIADALTIMASMKITRLQVANDSTITLTAAFADKSMFGEHYYLALGGQSVNDSYFGGATVTGVGTAANHTLWNHCEIGAATIPPCRMIDCGIGHASGKFTAASNGDYTFINCYSLVPGSGSPEFDFDTNISGVTGINNRGWKGGANYSGLDVNVTLSHEVLAGGGTTIVSGGGNTEIRGITRSLTITGAAAETIQFVGVTGPVAISGTTTAAINLYGVTGAITDTSSAAVVTTTGSIDANVETILGKVPTNYMMGSSDVGDHDGELALPVLDAANTELASIPSSTGSLRNMIQHGFENDRHKKNMVKSTGVETLYKDDGSTPLGTRTNSDDGSTVIRGEQS